MKVFVFLILFIILLSQGCTIFEKNERLLATHQKSNGDKILICYVSLGATTNDVIHVKKYKESQPLWVSEKYNFLKRSELINDSSLLLLVSDTGYNNYSNKMDTVLINVK